MQDVDKISRGIARQCVDLNFEDKSDLDVVKSIEKLIATALREYGEAEVKADRQRMHREPSMERIKEADTAGYRRGVEEIESIMKDFCRDLHGYECESDFYFYDAIEKIKQRGTGGGE